MTDANCQDIAHEGDSIYDGNTNLDPDEHRAAAPIRVGADANACTIFSFLITRFL